jgi:prepilin-type N-terminal cleavage/methylation domain-containing protein
MIAASRHRKSKNGMRRNRGFTLVELAIVLAVAGLLFVGLWRLLSSGNQQVRDQTAASQMQQLISATKVYLASSQGQTFLQPLGPQATANLALPAVGAACVQGTFCSYLPSNFNTGTVNSYGQTYSIDVLKDGSAAGTVPTTYSFMITTTGGDTIPDTSGGRISAFIGGDGGFIYTNSVCGAPANQMACGSYGTWAVNAAAAGTAGGYGFGLGGGGPAPVSGHIATRTYITPTSDSQMPWLARIPMQNDTPFYYWNTMDTDLFMGGTSNQGTATAGNIYLYPPAGSPAIAAAVPGSINLAAPGATAGGGAINIQGGTVNIEGGTITGNNNIASNITITNSTAATNSQISVGSGCQRASPAPGDPCPWSIQITEGDESVSNMLLANVFYANTFIYENSDIRVKTNIQPLTGSLEDIMKLKPVSFTMKANGKPSFGVIAQDLEKVYPQLVAEGAGVKAVNYDGLIGPLIGAVQELKKENDELRQKLDAQQKRQDQLEKEIRAGKNAAP